MRILHVAAEIFPLVKTGGLADVVAALPPALVKRGLEARVLLPGFPGVMAGMRALVPVCNIGPLFGAAKVNLLSGRLPDSDLPAYVVDAPFLYRRQGNPYLGPDGKDWSDNHRRFALLGWTAAHLASGELDADWSPDIVHAHDWHAGLSAAYIRQNPTLGTGTVYTIHNMAFQGVFPLDCRYDLGLPMSMMSPPAMEFQGGLSFLKAGLFYSHKITTVSPTYAREIGTAEFGWGMDGIIRDRGADLSGILNGVDYAVWKPDDPLIAKAYTAKDLKGKKTNKQALQSEFRLSPLASGPLFGVVSRLTAQKGMDLLLAALADIVYEGGQLVVLGTGDSDLEAGFRDAALAHPAQVAIHLGYDEAMSHRIIAGADVLLVPSLFEPCGLTQLYALRYGTLPLVRRVGGLADTVVDATAENLQAQRATGFVFADASRQALGARIREVCALYRDQATWKQMQQCAMRQDFSWDDSAANYEMCYRALTADKQGK